MSGHFANKEAQLSSKLPKQAQASGVDVPQPMLESTEIASRPRDNVLRNIPPLSSIQGRTTTP